MKDGPERKPVDLSERTKAFSLRVIQLYSALPQSTVAPVIGKQLLRSGTSVGAHYREAARSRSDAEFVSKVEGALQELEETAYWLELLGESRARLHPSLLFLPPSLIHPSSFLLHPFLHRCTLAEPPFAKASTSASLAMVTSPGKVVSNAPWAQPMRSDSSGDRPPMRP